MRIIDTAEIIAAVSKELTAINTVVAQDLHLALAACRDAAGGAGRLVMDDIMMNAELAGQHAVPMCQDTGMVVFFVRLGHEIRLTEPLAETLNKAVSTAYTGERYRPSVVADPISRRNTGDNTPAVIHLEHVSGDTLTIEVMAKGFGSENMSGMQMLKPSDGYAGVVRFVLQTVVAAGGNPCPPIIVGVGVGGTFEQAPLLAKKALLREIGSVNEDPLWAEREADLLARINELGIGPGGLGGGDTALAVHIATAATHIAGLPVAVNISCHASRHGRVIL